MPTEDLTYRQRTFRSHVRRALLHLYDPANLRRSPLLDLLGISSTTDKVFATRQVIQKAIQALKPDRSVSVRPMARQIFQILNYRYLEQMPQKEVVAELAISLRQLQRVEAVALDTLSTYLLEEYHVRLEEIKISELAEEDPISADSLEEGETEHDSLASASLSKELKWARQSAVPETANLKLFLEQILDTTAPLLNNLGMKTTLELPAVEIPITGNLMALRQGFINILTALSSALPPCSLNLKALLEDGQVVVQIDGSCNADLSALTGGEERMQLAAELFQIGAGRLELRAAADGSRSVCISLPSQKRLVVMVVDDNADTLALVNAYLSAMGYIYQGVRDPLQVLSMIKSAQPDIIVLDVMLPGVDGWQILGWIKHNPDMALIPVIISTILPQAELAFSLGADGFLRKPFTQAELSALISQLTQMGPKLS